MSFLGVSGPASGEALAGINAAFTHFASIAATAAQARSNQDAADAENEATNESNKVVAQQKAQAEIQKEGMEMRTAAYGHIIDTFGKVYSDTQSKITPGDTQQNADLNVTMQNALTGSMFMSNAMANNQPVNFDIANPVIAGKPLFTAIMPSADADNDAVIARKVANLTAASNLQKINSTIGLNDAKTTQAGAKTSETNVYAKWLNDGKPTVGKPTVGKGGKGSNSSYYVGGGAYPDTSQDLHDAVASATSSNGAAKATEAIGPAHYSTMLGALNGAYGNDVKPVLYAASKYANIPQEMLTNPASRPRLAFWMNRFADAPANYGLEPGAVSKTNNILAFDVSNEALTSGEDASMLQREIQSNFNSGDPTYQIKSPSPASIAAGVTR